ncbi:phosphatidylinositol kinase- protein kinase tor1 [Tulasnella sp. 332]|nr:phosphatidylinositol kinase- protein kinase tor1 [Tulasnella sp. 332]
MPTSQWSPVQAVRKAKLWAPIGLYRGGGEGIPTAKDPEGLMLALGALSDFDFSGEYRHVLTDITRACTLRYLDHDTPGVRKAAVHALCKLLARDSCRKDCDEDEIVERLVALAVTDSDPSVRLASLISLDRDFDTHLAQEKVMSSLSLVLNDEVYINREQAMRIFARLVDLNPEHVIPPMRRALMHLSTELGHCTAVRSQTESVKLLTILIAASSRLIKPHVSSLTAVLVTRSWAQDVTVASGSLRCLGELATVAGTMLVDHLPEIMALLTKTLQPPSHIRKQDAAVFALGQVCSNSGYVIDPLLDHPSLWGLLSGTLKEDGSVFGKRSVVKSLGILGALNPSEREASNINCYRLSEPIRKSKAHGIEEVLKPNGPPSEEYFRAVVICELLKILRNNSLTPIHHFVIEVVMTLFKAQSAQFASYLPQILPSFFNVIRNSGPRMREFYLQQLAILIQIVGRSIRNHSKDIVDLVHELQISSQLGAHVLALVESLVRALNAEFSPFLPTVLPQMLQLLEGPIDKKIVVLLRVFQVLQALGPNVEEYLQLIIPPTLRVIEHRNVPSTLRLSALWTIDSLSRRVDLANDASRILHALTRALDHGDLEWRNEVLNTLCVFVVMFGSRYVTFIKMVHKSSLAHSLEGALASSSVPAEVIRILLNLAEFMEREIQPLPINLKVMRECAITYHSYAKALHYTETQYFSDPNSTPIIEALINIHKNLQQDDAAWGILTVARIRNLVTRHEEWYEKLGRWGDALEGYDQRLTLEADDVGAISGRLRCLQALGEWEDLSISTQGLWIAATNAERQRIAPVAAAAAWFLGQWHLIEDYIRSMKRGSADRHFYGAILAVHRSQDEVAAQLIHKTRDFLSEELATLRMESYEQSYSIVVRVQMLAELEEAMVYKTYRSKNQAEKMDTMRKMWRKRLEGCKPDIDTWQRILQIRRLALEPEEDRIMWTKLANMCRKQGKMTLANKAINALISKTGRKEISDSLTGLFCAQPTTPTSPSLDLTVLYAHLKYTWAIGKRSESLAWMSSLSERLAVEIEHYPANTNNPTQDTLSIEDMRKLLARCLVKRGQWQQALTVSWSMGALHSILTTYALATELDPSRYKAWNTWALANYQVITILERESGMEDVAAASCVGYVASAIRGHDDLRQDERVMQLFGLVNKLLARDANSSKRHLYIQRCSIIPLAPNVGLIGWVYDTDTIHALVQEYRENHSIRTDIEYHLIKDMAPDYEDLCIMQKVESLEYALQRTTGQDLYTILWQKSANSEEWVNRRSTYTRSLAVNSMAGYILGLGDRHPSNILLSRITGQVVHIDFGDCFDVAMMREMYAEKIPFRLTRMLTNAMEVCGVHGTYKIACEISMTILRDNGESLLAVLETFVWDPLLSWRLIQDREDQQAHQNRAGAAARVPIRRRLDENAIFNERTNGPSVVDQKRNTKALEALKRVEDKLNGRVDFFNRHAEPRSLPVEAQVEALMAQAMSVENLAQCFHGWCPYW